VLCTIMQSGMRSPAFAASDEWPIGHGDIRPRAEVGVAGLA